MAGSPPVVRIPVCERHAGATWAQRPMPQGFDPTSSLACGGVSDCVAGGRTTDSRSSSPLPMVVSSFLRHPAARRVGAPRHAVMPLASVLRRSGSGQRVLLCREDRRNVSLPRVTEARRSVTPSPIIAGDSMESLSCSSSNDCIAVGSSDTSGPDDVTGVAARTTDGGRKWSVGMLPAGFGISPNSQLSCADGSHCWSSG